MKELFLSSIDKNTLKLMAKNLGINRTHKLSTEKLIKKLMNYSYKTLKNESSKAR